MGKLGGRVGQSFIRTKAGMTPRFFPGNRMGKALCSWTVSYSIAVRANLHPAKSTSARSFDECRDPARTPRCALR
jgi:hypothetical protein